MPYSMEDEKQFSLEVSGKLVNKNVPIRARSLDSYLDEKSQTTYIIGKDRNCKGGISYLVHHINNDISMYWIKVKK